MGHKLTNVEKINVIKDSNFTPFTLKGDVCDNENAWELEMLASLGRVKIEIVGRGVDKRASTVVANCFGKMWRTT